MLSTIIFKYHPQLFSKREKYLVTGLIIAGVIYSRSRSGMFAIMLFWLSLVVYEKHQFKGLMALWGIAIIFNYAVSFEDIIRQMGLAEFFRIESIETGSGRKIAFEHAWQMIKEHPVEGYGIGYTEKYYTENHDKLAKEGHVGGVHNSFLWVWLDMGLFGLLAFIYGWFKWFKEAFSINKTIIPVGLAVLFSVNIESWLFGSLNHVTIQLIIILSLLSSPEFLGDDHTQKQYY
jgi:O-antigen ligase